MNTTDLSTVPGVTIREVWAPAQTDRVRYHVNVGLNSNWVPTLEMAHRQAALWAPKVATAMHGANLSVVPRVTIRETTGMPASMRFSVQNLNGVGTYVATLEEAHAIAVRWGEQNLADAKRAIEAAVAYEASKALDRAARRNGHGRRTR